MFNNTIDKNSRAYLERKVASARHNLLLLVVFTVINLVLLLTESGSYFLFSASVPYEITFVGAVINYQEFGQIMGTYTYTALVIAAAILGLYVVCWVLAKKKPVWYIVACVLFVLDTLAMVYINLEYLGDYVIDLVFHVFVLVELFQAVIANKKLKNMPVEILDAEGNVIAQEPAPAAAMPEEPWNRKDIE